MDWNALPDPFISSAEGAEDGVAKFISLVRLVLSPFTYIHMYIYTCLCDDSVTVNSLVRAMD